GKGVSRSLYLNQPIRSLSCDSFSVDADEESTYKNNFFYVGAAVEEANISNVTLLDNDARCTMTLANARTSNRISNIDAVVAGPGVPSIGLTMTASTGSTISPTPNLQHYRSAHIHTGGAETVSSIN